MYTVTMLHIAKIQGKEVWRGTYIKRDVQLWLSDNQDRAWRVLYIKFYPKNTFTTLHILWRCTTQDYGDKEEGV